MEDILNKIRFAAENCNCGNHQPITLQEICLKSNATLEITAFLKKNGMERVIVVADQFTFRAAGKKVEASISNTHIDYRTCLIQPNLQGDIAADEQSILQLILEVTPDQTDAMIAVGSGTLHDIVRFVSYKMQIPFISVPTAPSVDGFTSKGAPIIIHGHKTTIPACGPLAIFADIDVLKKAPQSMIAAGFGDMLAKYTSLFDWKFGRLTANEPYCQAAELLTSQALNECIQHMDEMAKGSERGVTLLMSALIESGLAMLLFGQSHPASGAEHHLSHYWEMEYIRQGKRQLLHGAKVAVACAEISELYHDIVENQRIPLDQHEWEQLRIWIKEVPTHNDIRRMISIVQGPTTLTELGVNQELLIRSLEEAHEVRPQRETLLKAYNLNEADKTLH